MMLCNLRVCIFILLSHSQIGLAVENTENFQRDTEEDTGFQNTIQDFGSGMADLKQRETTHEQPLANQYEWNRDEGVGSAFAYPEQILNTQNSHPEGKNDCGFNVCTEFQNACPENQVCNFDFETCSTICACPENMENCMSFDSFLTNVESGDLASGDMASEDMTSEEMPFTELQGKTEGPMYSPTQEMLSTQQCVEYLHHPASCAIGFPCINGECINKSLVDGAHDIYCKCGPGWTGMTCDTCCSLDCEHGNCEIQNENMTCACEFGYEGEFCEHKRKPTTNPTSTHKF